MSPSPACRKSWHKSSQFSQANMANQKGLFEHLFTGINVTRRNDGVYHLVIGISNEIDKCLAIHEAYIF